MHIMYDAVTVRNANNGRHSGFSRLHCIYVARMQVLMGTACVTKCAQKMRRAFECVA